MLKWILGNGRESPTGLLKRPEKPIGSRGAPLFSPLVAFMDGHGYKPVVLGGSRWGGTRGLQLNPSTTTYTSRDDRKHYNSVEKSWGPS